MKRENTKGTDSMKKLIMSVVALVLQAAVAANEVDMGAAFSNAFFNAFKSVSESVGSEGFSADKHKAYEGPPMVVPIGYLVKPALPTNVRKMYEMNDHRSRQGWTLGD